MDGEINNLAEPPAMDGRVRDFIDRFFETSDVPGSTDEWVNFFDPDATVQMGDKTARGEQEIRKLRESMWEKVSARKHVITKVEHEEPPPRPLLLSAETEPDESGLGAGAGAEASRLRSSGSSKKEETVSVKLAGTVEFRFKTAEPGKIVEWTAQAHIDRRSWRFISYAVWF